MDIKLTDGYEQVMSTDTPGTSVIVNIANNTNGFTVQAVGQTTSGTGTATVNVYLSNDGVNFIDTAVETITLTTGTTAVSDGFAVVAKWAFIKIVATALTGTGATLKVSVGV